MALERKDADAGTRRNNAQFLRREILIRLARAFRDGNLEEEAERIPFDMRPKGTEAPFRCCVYKERAILRARAVAGLGLAVEEDDEMTSLSRYAVNALRRSREPVKRDEPIMTVIDIACRGCPGASYFVTELCQGCLARPCMVNCAFGAVSMVNGRAVIDPAACKKCGRCADLCPYRAIAKIHVPCEEACPVAAIHKGDEGRAVIDFDRCTSCGRCMRACPFGAIMEKSRIIDVLTALQNDKNSEEGENIVKQRPVIALIAPALIGQFPVEPEKIVAGLHALGFDAVYPVAAGADRTALAEGAEFMERMKRGDKMMTSSCCPAYIETVRKHLPELAPFVSATPTPMHYAAEEAKRDVPDSVTVFIGPCVAKRKEGQRDPLVDYVLTFEEIGALFVAYEIELAELEPAKIAEASADGKGFAVTGGVAKAVTNAIALLADQADERDAADKAGGSDKSGESKKSGESDKSAKKIVPVPFLVNGLSPAGIKQLKAFATGTPEGNLVEVMTCPGGCVGGAGTIGNPKVSTRMIAAAVSASKPLGEMKQPPAP